VASAEPAAQPLLQIGMGPPPGSGPGAAPSPEPSTDGLWARLPSTDPPAEPTRVTVSGIPVLVCSVGGTLYAYRDECASCAASLAGGSLNGNILTCPACDARFNVRLAGRSLAGAEHLSPLPLLTDAGGARVAVPT